MNNKEDFCFIYARIVTTIQFRSAPLWESLTEDQQASFGIGITKVMDKINSVPTVAGKWEKAMAPVLRLAIDNGTPTGLTTDCSHPDLNTPPNPDGTGQNKVYLVLSEEEIAKGFVRPYRDTYIHDECGSSTKMGTKISETYAANPKFYGATFCVSCQTHFPVGQFRWTKDNEVVGS